MITCLPSSDTASRQFRDLSSTSALKSSSSDCDCWLLSCHQTWLSTFLLASNSKCHVHWVHLQFHQIREVLASVNASFCQAKLMHEHFLNSWDFLQLCHGWPHSWNSVSRVLNHIHHLICFLGSFNFTRHYSKNRNVKVGLSIDDNFSPECLLLQDLVASVVD